MHTLCIFYGNKNKLLKIRNRAMNRKKEMDCECEVISNCLWEKGVAEGAVATSVLLFDLITFSYFSITIKSNFVIEGNKRDQNI